MDWLKLFALLVAVASVQITAEGPKKKIRIHLPQKVKHIHHHKKIYITNHPAPSQYAPAYLPGVKGAVALPSNVARPSVASIVPLNSVELYDEARSRLPGVSPAASKLLPLYRARGHYGPNPSFDLDEQDYDLAPPPEPNDIYEPTGYAANPVAAPPPASVIRPKKIKFVKISDYPRKKVVRKFKPKQVLVRNKVRVPPVQPQPEEELPVSSFHEQFYSDLDEAGTIRKIKKPPRIEKIIDGDTEHIHTYSEEHIHKVVFDDDSKVTGVVGVDPVGTMGALNTAHPLVPLKNAQTLVAVPTSSFTDLTVMGSMGTPSHLEYASYNPHDVTHDHVFHDHGEIPPGIDINKDGFRQPPKVSYNSHGFKVTGDTSKRYHKRLYGKPTKPTTHDFSYYESMYSSPPTYRAKKITRPTISTPHYDLTSETINDFKPIPAFQFKDKRKPKTHTYRYNNKSPTSFPLQQASVPAPFSVSSTVVHDYDRKHYPESNVTPIGFNKYYVENLDFDTFAAPSNIYTTEDKTGSSQHQGKGKKSVSTQNINFGGQDRQTFVDHLAASASSNSAVSVDPSPTALEGFSSEFGQTTSSDGATPTPFTIKETSPEHQYYSAMALKALQAEETEASNNNLQYAEPPTMATETTESPLATTTSQTIHIYKIQSTDAIPEPEYISETRVGKKRRVKHKNNRQRYVWYNNMFKELDAGYEGTEQPTHTTRHTDDQYFHSTDSSSVRVNNPKYGDKI